MNLHVASCLLRVVCCELSVADCRTPCAEYHLCHFTIPFQAMIMPGATYYDVWSPTSLVCVWTHKDYTLSVNLEYSKLT